MASQEQFICEICLQKNLQAACQKLDCGHVHCKVCISTHVAGKIQSGRVNKIDCPSVECAGVISPSIIQSLVPPDLFSRYNRLLQKRALEARKDIAFCPLPMCEGVAPKHEDSYLTKCPLCEHAFCTNCNNPWHGAAPCQDLPQDLKALKEAYDNASSEMRTALENKYGRKYLFDAFSNMETEKWIQDNTKKCPSCSSSIEKTTGCNKMACFNCSANFCWLCGVEITGTDPYSHFSGGSTCAGMLFEGAVIDENAPLEDEMEVEDEIEDEEDDEWNPDENAPDWVLPDWVIRDWEEQYMYMREEIVDAVGWENFDDAPEPVRDIGWELPMNN